jgi:hypothetical protein
MALRDCSPSVDWEDSKENMVPVKQGRMMAASPVPMGLAQKIPDLEEDKRCA